MDSRRSPRRRARRALGAGLVLSFLAAAAGIVPAPLAGAETPSPPEDAPRGLVYRGIHRAQPGGPCQGAYELEHGQANVSACTHGPDPAPPGIDVRQPRPVASVAASVQPGAAAATDPAAVRCLGDGTSGNRVQLVYARAADVTDRYTQLVTPLQQAAVQVDSVFDISAAETGGARHVRFVTDAACHPVVAHVVLSSAGDDSLDTTISELRSQGYSRSDRKYLVWVDANVYCGVGQVYGDDRPTQVNYSNGPPTIPGEVARVDNGCWGLAGQSVEAHELMHTLGGVQTTAPHATSYNHCTDDYDRMCYNDGSGAQLRVVCPSVSHENVFDCNHDDYFHTSPTAASYLATHWNTANNSFLAPVGVASASGWNGVGALGNNTTVDSSVPVQAGVPPAVVGVSAGTYHSLAVRADGTVWAWGWNAVGQLGDGTTTDRRLPVQVPGLTGVTAVAAGAYHSLALRSDGTVWSWGWNPLGELGDGTTTERHTPVQVSGLSGVVAVAAGGYHNLAVKADGTVWAWGWNGVGQLGDGTAAGGLTPVRVAGLSGVTAVGAGGAHSLALKADGTVWAWGWNAYGQLGDGTILERHLPFVVPGLTDIGSIAAGFYHSLVATRSGSVAAWGWNAQGQLGDGTTTDRWSPVTVPGLSGVKLLAGAYFHSVAVGGDGRVATWGWNGYGQLGDGTTADHRTPVRVPGPSTAVSIAGGALETLAA